MKIRNHKAKLIPLAAAALLLLLLNIAGNVMVTEHYTLSSGKLTAPVRIVFLSDLHNCTYGGAEQSVLWSRIQAEEPDIVLFGGDVIDYKGGTGHALQLMKMVQDTYPCAYASGNHEVMRGDTETFYSEVEALGIPVLHGTHWDVQVNGQDLHLSGIVHVYNAAGQLADSCQGLPTDTCNILLLHEPQQLDEIIAETSKDQTRFDLVLSGHAHGGQWRLPYLLEQGLYAPDQGMFPEFTNGQREESGTVQIVSRGLAKPLRMFPIPRIFNQPELTVVDIAPMNVITT